MKSVARLFWLWFVLGSFYAVLETVWRGGTTHPVMVLVGGLCGVCVSQIAQLRQLRGAPVLLMSLIGTSIVLLIEFASGCVLNLWWGWDVWDYAERPVNLFGQICLLYAALWFVIMPFVIWLTGWLRCKWWGEPHPGAPWLLYANLVRGR